MPHAVFCMYTFNYRIFIFKKKSVLDHYALCPMPYFACIHLNTEYLLKKKNKTKQKQKQKTKLTAFYLLYCKEICWNLTSRCTVPLRPVDHPPYPLRLSTSRYTSVWPAQPQRPSPSSMSSPHACT